MYASNIIEIKHVWFVYYKDSVKFSADIVMLNPSAKKTWFKRNNYEVLPLDSLYVYTDILC
jgi:hypothetical protein